MNKPAIILIGGGGHCKSCIDVIEQENKYIIAGIVDVKAKLGSTVLGYPIIGNDDEITSFIKKGFSFLITVGHLGNSKLRIKLFNLVKENNGYLPVIISPKAYVSKHSIIEKGSIIMHDTLINAGARIGENCIINTKALIEHDAIVGEQTHVSTGVIVNGSVEIGERCFIGSGSVFKNNVHIISNSIIGAGAVVIKDVPDNSVVVGVPGRIIKQRVKEEKYLK